MPHEAPEVGTAQANEGNEETVVEAPTAEPDGASPAEQKDIGSEVAANVTPGNEQSPCLVAPKLPAWESPCEEPRDGSTEADAMKWKGEITHPDVAILAPDGSTVACKLCADGRSGGIITMRHPYCPHAWNEHCTRNKTHIQRMVARARRIELGIKVKSTGKQQLIGRWFNPKN